ncbi:hypothetical protein ACHAXT_008342 [Thalassiosira profunda]
MIRRAMLLCAVAAAALASLPAQVAAFANAPARGPRPLKGASSPSASSPNTALYAAKKKEDVVNLKKADFVAAIAEKTGMTKADSDVALAAVLNVIATEVADGKRINLPGFGTFKLNFRAARKGRNPATGAEIDIKASNSPSFSASKTFKDMCNPDR